MNAIEVRGITKVYDGFTLDNVTLDVPTGSIMGIVGENGAGKTTLIKLIMNAVEADKGSLKVLGTDNKAKTFPTVKQEMGIVLDECHFPEVLTPKEIGRVMNSTYDNWDSEKFKALLQRLGLPERKKIIGFSRGMRMKLSIAVALSHHARLLLLDEATSGLDPMVRSEILEVFNEFTRDERNTILLSSHIVSDLEKICDYIAFIRKGKLVLCEEKDVLLETYAILKVMTEQYECINQSAIVAKRKGAYGYELLVKRTLIPQEFKTEQTSLEDIILLMSKEGR